MSGESVTREQVDELHARGCGCDGGSECGLYEAFGFQPTKPFDAEAEYRRRLADMPWRASREAAR